MTGAGAAAGGKFGLDDLDDAPASVSHQKPGVEVAPAVGAQGKSLSEQLMSLHAPAGKSSGGGVGSRSTSASRVGSGTTPLVSKPPAAPPQTAVGGAGGNLGSVGGGATSRALEPRPAAELNQDKKGAVGGGGSGKADDASKERHKTFLLQTKKRLGNADYLRFVPSYTRHPIPDTHNPIPNALHPTPCTLHPAPYTLHPTPCALHPTPYTPPLRRCVPPPQYQPGLG